jgi:hypothetical protein
MKKNILNLGIILAMSVTLFTACEKSEDDAKASTTTTGTTSTTATTGTTGTPAATFLASKTPSDRVAVLEDFTGVRCGYCPDGHVKAAAAQAELGADKFIIMAVHGGGYATPAAGWANFTTPYSSAFINQSSVAGYPAGTINRIKADDLGVSPQNPGGIAMSRGAWTAAARNVIAMPSPVNVGSKAVFNAATRELTVNVDLYYTAEEGVANNINVAFMQDKLMSKQSGAPTNPYEQNHVLRDLITGQWGDVIADAKAVGTKVSKTYTYTVPEDYHGTAVEGGGAVVIENCSVVVYVSRGKTDIITGVQIPITVK